MSAFEVIACLSAALLACSCGDSWTAAEREIVNGPSEVLRVLTVDNPADSAVLRLKSSALTEEMLRSSEYSALARKMVATVTDPSQDGVGIAGPQVGISRRIVAVMRLDKDGSPFELYPNIEITEKRGDESVGAEGCLSVPGRRGNVPRSLDIDIRYTSPATLADTVETVTGFTAVIFQHECDHLDGILYTDLCVQ